MHIYYTNKYGIKEVWPVSPEFIFEVGFCIKAAIEYCKSIVHSTLTYIDTTVTTSFHPSDTKELISCLETYIYIYSSCLIRDDIPVISVDTSVLYEFWTEFTSYWNLFCKLELEGLYLFILSCRTIDSFKEEEKDQLFLSKHTVPVIINTLEVLYPFGPKLETFIQFLKKANLQHIYFSTSKVNTPLLQSND